MITPNDVTTSITLDPDINAFVLRSRCTLAFDHCINREVAAGSRRQSVLGLASEHAFYAIMNRVYGELHAELCDALVGDPQTLSLRLNGVINRLSSRMRGIDPDATTQSK